MDDFIRLWSRTPFTAVYVTHNLNEAVRLGHRIVVLSRRPGRIQEIISIDMPLSERAARVSELASTHEQLWSLIRDEAAAADMELINA